MPSPDYYFIASGSSNEMAREHSIKTMDGRVLFNGKNFETKLAQDIARELNISVATVSRALTKPHMLRASTVARVRAAVDRLGYRPNLVARNLKSGMTGIIYVIHPSLSPFFLEIFKGIEQAALELGYSAVIAHTNRDPGREGSYFDQVASGRADGVLLVSTALFAVGVRLSAGVRRPVEGMLAPAIEIVLRPKRSRHTWCRHRRFHLAELVDQHRWVSRCGHYESR